MKRTATFVNSEHSKKKKKEITHPPTLFFRILQKKKIKSLDSKLLTLLWSNAGERLHRLTSRMIVGQTFVFRKRIMFDFPFLNHS